MRMSDTAGHSQHLKNTCHLVGRRLQRLLGAVAAFSVGVVPRQISDASRSARVRRYMAAGTLEPGFRRSTREWAELQRRACRPRVPSRGMDRRPRPGVVAAAAPGRTGLAATA
jgi:hypothetical protein